MAFENSNAKADSRNGAWPQFVAAFWRIIVPLMFVRFLLDLAVRRTIALPWGTFLILALGFCILLAAPAALWDVVVRKESARRQWLLWCAVVLMGTAFLGFVRWGVESGQLHDMTTVSGANLPPKG